MQRIVLAVLLLFGLAACQTTGAVETEYVQVATPVDRPCPDADTYTAVLAARPVPLRDQAAPATEDDRIAAERRQLGRYEARGEWADQAERVIRSCFERSGVDPPP